MADYDHIIVGSGINALVAAAMLSKNGKRVLVLEREDRFGGCMHTAEITAPGFHHDVMAATFVLFLTSPAHAALGSDLARHGLEFCHTPHPTAVLRPDGSSLGLTTDRAVNIKAFKRTLCRRRRPPQRRCGRNRGRCTVPVRAAGRRTVELADSEIAGGPSLEARRPRTGCMDG